MYRKYLSVVKEIDSQLQIKKNGTGGKASSQIYNLGNVIVYTSKFLILLAIFQLLNYVFFHQFLYSENAFISNIDDLVLTENSLQSHLYLLKDPFFERLFNIKEVLYYISTFFVLFGAGAVLFLNATASFAKGDEKIKIKKDGIGEGTTFFILFLSLVFILPLTDFFKVSLMGRYQSITGQLQLLTPAEVELGNKALEFSHIIPFLFFCVICSVTFFLVGSGLKNNFKSFKHFDKSTYVKPPSNDEINANIDKLNTEAKLIKSNLISNKDEMKKVVTDYPNLPPEESEILYEIIQESVSEISEEEQMLILVNEKIGNNNKLSNL